MSEAAKRETIQALVDGAAASLLDAKKSTRQSLETSWWQFNTRRLLSRDARRYANDAAMKINIANALSISLSEELRGLDD